MYHGCELGELALIIDLEASGHQKSVVNTEGFQRHHRPSAMSKRRWLREHASVRYQTDAKRLCVEHSAIGIDRRK